MAKRIVRSAVRRNTVKRVAREAWRAAQVQGTDRSDPDNASAQTTSGRSWMLRLRVYPGAGKKAPHKSAVRAGQPKSVLARSNVTPVKQPLAAPVGFSQVKRLLRADADRLFSQGLNDGKIRDGKGREPGRGNHREGQR